MLDLKNPWYAHDDGNAWTQDDWEDNKEFSYTCREGREMWDSFVKEVENDRMTFDGVKFNETNLAVECVQPVTNLEGMNTQIKRKKTNSTNLGLKAKQPVTNLEVNMPQGGMSKEELKFNMNNFKPGRKKGAKNKKISDFNMKKVFREYICGKLNINANTLRQRMRRANISIDSVDGYIDAIKKYC